MIWVKHFAGLKHTKGDVNELTHRGADDLHFGFATELEATAESDHDRVVSGGDYGRQKQRFANPGVTGL